jgi:hypothetical protein
MSAFSAESNFAMPVTPSGKGGRRYGETPRHATLKVLAYDWARGQGFSLVAPEVAFPHRRFRVDVAACLPAIKAPSRPPVQSLDVVLKAAAVFECKQVRSDLVRDNKERRELRAELTRLEARRLRLESLLQLHLPHLAKGESLFPEFDCYALEQHRHAGYTQLLSRIAVLKRALVHCTKFDRLLAYGVANLHYLVVEKDVLAAEELPPGWGLLVRRDDALELVSKPTWQPLGVEAQVIFLQRLAAAATGRRTAG